MQASAELSELADAHGIMTTFYDWHGNHRHVGPDTLVSVLTALGVFDGPEEPTADDVTRASARSRDAAWRQMMPATLVVRNGSVLRFGVHVPDGASVSVEIEREDGGRVPLDQVMVWVEPRDIDGDRVGEATFEVPDDVPLGYHIVHARSGDRTATSQLIVVPVGLAVPPQRGWGFMAQLYAVRSRQSWSIGDLGDLRELVTWSGRDLGADFVLINPLHAVAPVPPMEPSPYFPSSRQFVNPLYLRIEDVPEVAALPAADVAAVAAPLKARNTMDEDLDRDTVWSAKKSILERVFAERHERRPDDDFADFRAMRGEALRDFATWCALVEVHGPMWREWPTALRDPRGEFVAEFRAAEAERVEFHSWLQWLCARQLAGVQAAAHEAGMTIGVLHDVAVGVSPDGFDAWALHDVLAQGVTLGAPPDMYNQQGQSWGLPPWQPEALAASRYAPFRDLVRASLAHCGGVRIDHIIGLFRQWWVPVGASPAHGAYVRLDHEAMLGIVLLEAHRVGAVVVGEDLGNVEWWVRDYLRARGVFGTSILWFEHDDAGHPLPADRWREVCLASVTTHDLPPAAGYLTGEHVELRHELGLLELPIENERAKDEAQRLGWLVALADAGFLERAVVTAIATVPEPGTVSPRRDSFHSRAEPYVEQIVEALHAYLASTPARLVGVYLPDVVGDRRPVNQPGTIDEYPNWRIPMADAKERPILLEDVMASAAAGRLAHVVGGRERSVTVAPSPDQART